MLHTFCAMQRNIYAEKRRKAEKGHALFNISCANACCNRKKAAATRYYICIYLIDISSWVDLAGLATVPLRNLKTKLPEISSNVLISKSFCWLAQSNCIDFALNSRQSIFEQFLLCWNLLKSFMTPPYETSKYLPLRARLMPEWLESCLI